MNRLCRRLERLEDWHSVNDWRRFARLGIPRDRWPAAAQDAALLSEILGRHVPSIEAASDEDLKSWHEHLLALHALIVEREAEEKLK